MNFLVILNSFYRNPFDPYHHHEEKVLGNYLGLISSKFRNMNYKIIHHAGGVADYYEKTKARKKVKKILLENNQTPNAEYNELLLKQDDESIPIDFKNDFITNFFDETACLLSHYDCSKAVLTGFHLEKCVYMLTKEILNYGIEKNKIKIAGNCVLPLRNYDTYNFDHLFKIYEDLGIEIVHI